MTERVLGPTGSRRRRRFMIGPFLLIAACALLFTAGAQAVHDVSAFELDKNAADDPATTADDWNSVYAQVSLDGNDTGNDDKCIALGAVECSFVSDLDGHSIFTTGGSKDDLDIPSWRHKDGSVPPKDEITNAYAAKYIVSGEQILYFGADRFAQNGSADFGFWFFRSPVSTNTDGTFSGTHVGTPSTPGDILILGTFTQGGATSNIRVFEWVGTGGNATSNGTVEGPTGAFGDCVPGSTNDQGCGTVNSGLVPVAWPYTPSQGAAGSIPSGGFVEGGINLTDLGIPGCFSSFMAETRSSPSVDATLKDFVLGNFEACDSNLTTTPGTSATPSVALTDTNANTIPDIGIGTGTVAVKDKASMVVNGIDTWTGNLKFFICGPIASGECTSGGVQIGPAAGVTMDNTSAQQDSAAANLTSAGRYCWRAEFTSATTGVPSDSDASAGECFEVLPVTPSLDTAAVTSPVNLGDAAQDNATLSGTATQPGTNGGNATYPSINATDGAAAGGKITFTLLKANCTDLAAGTGTNPQDFTPISGDNTYGPVSFTPNAPGTYHWKAQYVPVATDVNNIGSTHNGSCNDTDEAVVVNKAPTEISTSQSVYPNDSATVSVAAANQGTGFVAGSVKFRLYNSLANCQATTPSDTVGVGGLLYKESKALPGTEYSSTVSTGNSSVAVSTDTTVYWLVEFTSTNTAQFGRNSVCVENTQTTFTNDAGPGSAP
jgi:hypothetical protein